MVRGIRETRALHNIPPGRKLDALIKATGRSEKILREMRPLVAHLAVLSSLEIGATVTRPAAAVGHVLGDIEVYLAGLIDADVERERLSAKKKKLLEDARTSEARLSNDAFVGRAPADVVEKERQKLKDLRAQIDLIDAQLKLL